MPTHLEQILARTRADLARRMEHTLRSTLDRRASAHTPRGFAAALRARSTDGPAVIAELKKASPSKGLIRADFSAATLAAAMQAGGAAALSVLTDEPFFQGSLANLASASAATTLPCLRKDFIVDDYQIVEARAHGADAILLIAAALSDGELAHLSTAARDHELDVLCEIHTREELHRIRNVEVNMIGVNSRDLHNFEVRLETALDLAPELPAGVLHVAESGISTATDYRRLHASGYQAFLIGETFMRAPDPGQALAQWIADATQPIPPTEPIPLGTVPA